MNRFVNPSIDIVFMRTLGVPRLTGVPGNCDASVATVTTSISVEAIFTLQNVEFVSYLVRIVAVRRFIPKWQSGAVYDVKEVWIIEPRAPSRRVREVLHNLELSITDFKKQLLARFSANKRWAGRHVAALKIMMTIHVIHHIQTALPYNVRTVVENYFPVLPS